MIEYRTADSSQSEILRFFRDRTGCGRGSDLHNVSYHLMEFIMAHHGFDDFDSLVEFCENPNNLQPWLPSEADRIIFSDGLVKGLRKTAFGNVGLSQKTR